MSNVEERLQIKGIRPTAMRTLVYQQLAKQKTAVALTDIELAFTKADRTTLYRTIKTFEKKGVVHQIDDGTGILKYALCKPGCQCDIDNDLHLHFHCNNCETTVCLTEHKIPQISLPQGYEAEDVNLVIKGTCANCT
ncbi:transcriptional repressor [Marixanthomonas sp. SCSIO 43207]|uniref:Fur family transcriptional regulator n=1 Tax=Marixanthomonas sp. SCSIO 43207 TaxID=2779360 RepID=UPI001CA8C459|nr:transcriptional repressor [Marixanthomonas sp. SCSIO 43207]UAB80954.1 transcriptional repressor [Marixanthomonas sp. SCSIO 43207]